MSPPRAVCLKCNVPFRIDKNGIEMKAYTKFDAHYYTVRADRWKCPECNAIILIGFGCPYNHGKDVPSHTADEVVIVDLG